MSCCHAYQFCSGTYARFVVRMYKFYCCDCCEVFNVHLTFSANLEAESVSKQVKTSHADFLMACVMIVHADRTRDHINYRVTKRDA